MGKQAKTAKPAKKAQTDSEALEALTSKAPGALPEREALAAALNLSVEDADKVLATARGSLEAVPLASESSQPVQAAAKAKNKPRQPKAKAEPKEAPKRAAKKTAKAQQAVEAAPPASAEEAPVAEAAAAPAAALVPALLDAEVAETQKEAVEQPPATPVHQTRAPTSPALSDRTMTPFYRTKSESLASIKGGFLHHWLEKPKIPREVIVDDDEGEDGQVEQPPPEAVAHQTCMQPTCFSFSCFVSDSAAPACSSASWTVLTSKCVQAFYFLTRANDETPT